MFEQIELNRRRSALIVGVMGVLLVAVGMALGMFFSGQQEVPCWAAWWRWECGE